MQCVNTSNIRDLATVNTIFDGFIDNIAFYSLVNTSAHLVSSLIKQ